MKKALWLLAICAVMMFALTSVAYANTFSTYATWSTGGPNAGSAPSPHADYRLTTVKCAVCHAVHKAPTVDAQLGQPTQILLSTQAANACTFCHIQTNTAGIQLYNGQPSWYQNDVAYNHAQTAGCTGCHAVHGAGTIQSTDASITARILKIDPNGTGTQTGINWNYATGTHNEVISKFCTGCHPYYVGTYADGVGTDGQHQGSFGAGTYIGHIMTATPSPNYHAVNSASSASVTTQVAYAPDPYCRSCHDSGLINQAPGVGLQANDFPHYTLGLRFEKAGLNSAAAATDATTSPVQDGTCLKCHRNGVGQGAGQTF